MNLIWEMRGEQGELVYDSKAIKSTVVNHFKDLFSQKTSANLESQLNVSKKIPRFFFEEEGQVVGSLIIVEEVIKARAHISKDKSPSPYGWTVEFYLHFF